MGQYEDRVERQRNLLQAEEWAKGFSCMHVHSLSSMWYDTRPQDTEDGKMVTDIQYNSGLIKRTERRKENSHLRLLLRNSRREKYS